ncbi:MULTISPECIES: SRPBCC domain-containing protein [unclassified Amycolatopsis]|uniref:SRPBCC family protein n=1 Tax=unclassified Amycolatopsis TaxID=2618356 RepID=UPI001C6A569D|nr:SRPBCC domain-containing protein [Amycolatopsis sp. DSM 110486]QYN18478.1 SRPBCC domain-containing protein [Amycolatopsis sp. DSM 110486]
MTPDYQKTVSVNAAPDTVFDALTTVAGLGAWWTRVTGSGDAGGELRFFFSHPDPCVMRVDEATRPSVVRWTVTSCDFLPDWVGTRPAFTIVPVDGATELRFRHHGLTAELDCLDMCTRGWNHFTESLRAYAESGVGMPSGSPADLARRR